MQSQVYQSSNLWLFSFFRVRLLSLQYEEVVELIDNYEKQVEAIKKEIYRLAWYMRGGFTLNEMFNTSLKERKIISEIVEDNLKTTKDSGLAFF